MNAFDRVIGYEKEKDELLQICDMICHKEEYDKVGARMPRGLLLTGDPGLGKTLMAQCFIQESGLQAFTVRRTKSDGAFLDEITEAFRKAKDNAPAIVFLDDMDKFANEDDEKPDAEEYVTVQSGIDSVSKYDVFVLATVNNEYKLPDSLTRAGRFDRKITIRTPDRKNAYRIVQHYFENKPLDESVNLNDFFRMITYENCAELETLVNEAAVHAAYARREKISMEDMIRAAMKTDQNKSQVYEDRSDEEQLRRTALHEAGHLVVCEILKPGCVGMAHIQKNEDRGYAGQILQVEEYKDPMDYAVTSLAGMAAEELYYADHCEGWHDDFRRARQYVRDEIRKDGSRGMFLMDVSYVEENNSEAMSAQIEAVVHAEMIRYALKAKEILLKNRKMLERFSEEICDKRLLLTSDIEKIRNSVLSEQETQ